MSNVSTTPREYDVIAGEVRNVSIDLRGKLDSGELLTGSVTVTEVGSSDLSFANQAVNTEALTINGASVAIGQAVQFKVSGVLVGSRYRVKVTVATDATPPQTLIATIGLVGVDS